MSTHVHLTTFNNFGVAKRLYRFQPSYDIVLNFTLARNLLAFDAIFSAILTKVPDKQRVGGCSPIWRHGACRLVCAHVVQSSDSVRIAEIEKKFVGGEVCSMLSYLSARNSRCPAELCSKKVGARARGLTAPGIITKMCRKGPEKRQMFLFSDILVALMEVVTHMQVYGTPQVGNVFTSQHVMRLSDISIETRPARPPSGDVG